MRIPEGTVSGKPGHRRIEIRRVRGPLAITQEAGVGLVKLPDERRAGESQLKKAGCVAQASCEFLELYEFIMTSNPDRVRPAGLFVVQSAISMNS